MPQSTFKTIDSLDVAGKRVLVRLDLNVPMKNGKVTDATRIERAAPTLAELVAGKTRGRTDAAQKTVFVNLPGLGLQFAAVGAALYKKARAGQIKNFTGIDDPYESPLNPDLVLQSASAPPDVLAEQVIAHLRSIGKVP